MFTKLASILLAVVGLGLGGCATQLVDPHFEQLHIPPMLKAELAGKRLKDFPLYFEELVYRDVSTDKIVENDVAKGRESFITDFEVKKSPSTRETAYGNLFITRLKQQFVESGYRVVSTPCEECVTIRTDFAYWMPNPFRRVISAKFSMLRYGEVVVVSKDNAAGIWIDSIFQKETFEAYLKRQAVLVFVAPGIPEAWDMAINGKSLEDALRQ